MTSVVLALIGIAAMIIVWLAVKVGGDLLSKEVQGWLPHVSRHIVANAALALPEQRRDLLEVWQAELEDFEDRPITMLLVALRIWRDRKLTAKEAAAELAAEPAGRSQTGELGPRALAIISAAAHSGTRLWARVMMTARIIEDKLPIWVLSAAVLGWALSAVVTLLTFKGSSGGMTLAAVDIVAVALSLVYVVRRRRRR
jgi:hypothetical protein